MYRLLRSPMCEYLVNFLHKLRQLPERYMMNSVLENFTILQVRHWGPSRAAEVVGSAHDILSALGPFHLGNSQEGPPAFFVLVWGGGCSVLEGTLKLGGELKSWILILGPHSGV